MSRQHATPLLITAAGVSALTPISQHGEEGAVNEAEIQTLVHNHASALPIAEIDPMFVGAVPVCRELNTPAGRIDNLLITPSGLPVLVECKLWRNPEGRREVVGQILEYAKELSRWSSSDLHREVSQRLGHKDNALLELMRKNDPTLDEIQFNDALTANLRRGRFLLLILGDGIRERVETIAEYLQLHAGLHFSLGLVEFPIYQLPDGSRLVAPRVLVRTSLITRMVVALPDGMKLDDETGASTADASVDTDSNLLKDQQQAFWKEFLDQLHLDDPEQARPKPARMGYIAFTLPAPDASSWLTVYRDMKNREVGVFLSSNRNSAGERASAAIVEAWGQLGPQLGGTARIVKDRFGRDRILDSLSPVALDDPEARRRGFEWLAERLNTFVNVLRPLVRSAASEPS